MTQSDLISIPDFARDVAHVTSKTLYVWLKQNKLVQSDGKTPIEKYTRNNRNFFNREQAQVALDAMLSKS